MWEASFGSLPDVGPEPLTSDKDMINELPPDSPTERHWNFNDAIRQNFMLFIPTNQPVITATLNWKESGEDEAVLVGKYRLNFPALEAKGYVRLKDNRYFLRFQRTGNRIEIAVNRKSPALTIGCV